MFLFPFPIFLFLCAIAAWKLPRSRFRRVFRIALALFAIVSTHTFSNALIRRLEDAYSAPPLPIQADVIVVLSGMVNPLAGPGTRPEFLGSLDRILVGEELLRKGTARHLLISGGSGLILAKGESEATILGRWLTERGVPVRHIIIEPKSRNTAENARESAAIIRAAGWKKVVLVTSAFHMPRSVMCFRKAGVEVIPYPVDYYASRVFPGPEALVPGESALETTTVVMKEIVGIAAYWIRGYI